MQESEPQPDNKISPEQADAFAAELAPGWASEDQLEAEATAADGVAEAAPIEAPEPPPVQHAGVHDNRAGVEGDTGGQTVKNISLPADVVPAHAPEAAAIANEATSVSIQQPDRAPTEPSLVTPEQSPPAVRELEVREMRRAAAAPATVQVRAPKYDDVAEARNGKGRALANLALIVLGIGVGIASVVIYLEFRQDRPPPNANEGFQTAETATAEPHAARQPLAVQTKKPATAPQVALIEQAEQEAAEQEAASPPAPAKPHIVLRLKTTPPEATVTVDGEPFENPYEGEVALGGEHLFVASAHGYETERLRVRFDSDRRVQMDLIPVEQKKPAAKPRRRAKTAPRSTAPRSTAAKRTPQTTPAPRKPATFVTDNPY